MGFAFFSPGGPPPGPGAKDYHALLEEAKGKLQQAEQEKRGRTAAAAPANRDPAGGDRGLGRGQLCALRLPEFSCEKLEGIAPYQHSRQRVSIPAANRLVSIQTEVQDGHAIGQLWKCTIAGEDTTFQTNGAGTPPPPGRSAFIFISTAKFYWSTRFRACCEFEGPTDTRDSSLPKCLGQMQSASL